jgi:hypothetical protein
MDVEKQSRSRRSLVSDIDVCSRDFGTVATMPPKRRNLDPHTDARVSAGPSTSKKLRFDPAVDEDDLEVE